MGYTTGTLSAASDVAALATSLATACGWTDYGSGVVGKDGEYVRINTIDTNTVRIRGALSADMAANPTSHEARLRMTVWPVTYHAFVSTDPTDMVWIEFNENVSFWYHLAFGHIEKIGSWTGGAWLSASHHTQNYLNGVWSGSAFNGASVIIGSVNNGSQVMNPGAPWLITTSDNLAQATPWTFLHCEIDGGIWARNWRSDAPPALASAADAYDKLTSMPASSTWNGQLILQPMDVLISRSSNMCSIVGRVPHARWTRCTNVSDGDEVTLGSDTWKVFPFYKKDSSAPSGGFNVTHSGTYAVALRKNLT